MGEQCKGCPWLDEQKATCQRKPPRFCTVDTSDAGGPSKDLIGANRGDGRYEVPAK